MKKTIILIFVFILMPTYSLAMEDIINDQLETLDLNTFINESNQYTKAVFPDLDIKELINNGITGEINNITLYDKVLSFFSKEIVVALKPLGSILLIVIIHTILKNISSNLGNEDTAQIAYFVECILIVTIIVNDFATILTSIRHTIKNLVSFMNMLIPILLSLIIATGQISSGTILQPILFFSVVFIGNVINWLIIPVLTASFILSIVSNLSDKIQVKNLSNFLKTSVLWCMGLVITIFVGILSLEGTLTSSVDGITIKGMKSATSTFIPVVGKALGESIDAVLGAASLIKNSIGFTGIIVVIRNLYYSNNKVNNIKHNIWFCRSNNRATSG